MSAYRLAACGHVCDTCARYVEPLPPRPQQIIGPDRKGKTHTVYLAPTHGPAPHSKVAGPSRSITAPIEEEKFTLNLMDNTRMVSSIIGLFTIAYFVLWSLVR